jgi:hypothetical protein
LAQGRQALRLVIDDEDTLCHISLSLTDGKTKTTGPWFEIIRSHLIGFDESFTPLLMIAKGPSSKKCR